MDVVGIVAGLVAGQFAAKLAQDKIPALADGKIRGAAILGLGVVLSKQAPKQFRPVALGLAASGGYQVARELMPSAIAGIGGIGADQGLSPTEVDLIENMALESEMQGLEDDLDDTVNGPDTMRESVVDTVTGTDDDDDDGGGDDF